MVLLSLYFDDATIQDLADSRGCGQRHFRGMCRMFGFPMAKAKEVDMCLRADFIGLIHEVGNAAENGAATFEPRETLTEKVECMVAKILGDNWCTPAQAS